jgi:ribonuclease T1
MRKLLWDQRTYAAVVILVLLGSVLINFLVTGKDDDEGSSAEDTSATPSVDLDPEPSGSPDEGDDDPTLPTVDDPDAPDGPPTDRTSGLPMVGLSELPAEAEETAELIAAGGPFPYDDDGEEFLNSEGNLPVHPAGYYQVYTVDDPESEEPTERRLITGDGRELYWTDDLYETFQRVDPGR